MERSWFNLYLCLLYISGCATWHIVREKILNDEEKSYVDIIVIALWPLVMPVMIYSAIALGMMGKLDRKKVK